MLTAEEQTKHPTLAVINSAGGPPIKTFDRPLTSGGGHEGGLSPLYRGFHWLPDGQSLVYINTLSGVSNLWRQPLDGSRQLQITNFKSDLIYNFAYTRDGHTLPSRVAATHATPSSSATSIRRSRFIAKEETDMQLTGNTIPHDAGAFNGSITPK